MSNLDQCPSSKKNGQPAQKPRIAPDASAATGQRFWRSLEDLADTPGFRERLEREFPALASELSAETRRDFMKIMAAGLALAGVVALPGCRRPDHKIMTYAREPEDLVPGNALFYATAMPMPGGGAQGLLAKTIDGRPIKVEGNPLHPINQGKSDSLAQASVLDLYDADRSTHVRRDGVEASGGWQAFEEFAKAHFPRFDAGRGAGLCFLVEKATSPSRDAMRDRIKARWPQAQWLAYEPIDQENVIEGSRIAFGSPMRQRLSLAKAKRVVSLGRDFLMEPGAMQEARGFAAGRRVATKPGHAAEADMNRLYVVETMMTLTGGAADHRLRAAPDEATRLAMALASAIIGRLGGGIPLPATDAGAHGPWIEACADDIVEHRGSSVVLVGESQPAAVHAVFHAINEALGAVGPIVSFVPMGADEAQSSLESIRTLASAIDSGAVDTLVVIGANPVYDAPADLDFAAKFSRVPTRVHLGSHVDETGAASTWHVNRAHYLESWGDVEALDGGISAIQPMIAPLFEGKTELELLGAIVADHAHDAYEIVRRTWRERLGASEAEFDKAWRRALHDGRLAGSAPPPARASVRTGAIGSAASSVNAGAAGGMQAIFVAHPYLHDGRWANNGWLQETPHPTTKITWDNPALISPHTAEQLGVKSGDALTVEVGGRGMDIQAWVQPGLADNVVALVLGLGRQVTGRVGAGVGFYTYAVRTTSGMQSASAQVARKAGAARDGAYATLLACTQDHGSMEGRGLLREFDLAAFQKHGDEIETGKDSYGYKRELMFAERGQTESHTPVNKDVYLPKQSHGFESEDAAGGEQPPPFSVGPRRDQQWGMSIDLTMCSGCGACTTACQAENNIPIVGKVEVWKGREMHWIRVDRYYEGDGADPAMVVQPVPCMHCENAPCEVVCPVNATVHGTGGTNDMAYNRCIGTRYCLNNCPYKVRRFNWFDYATKEYKGGFGQLGEGLSEDLMPRNEAFVPPRLREKVNELRTMQSNPNVTVRSRGVMEKCTFCMQRINRARIETRLQDLDAIPDGFFQVACQQACPSDAIVFGDISDPNAAVVPMRDHARSYMMLAYLNTRPRVTYMARLRNPNPKIREPIVDPFHHGHGGHGGHDDGHGSDHHDSGAGSHEPGHVMSLPVLPDASRRKAMAAVVAGALA